MEGLFYVNSFLKNLMYDELKHHSASQGEDYIMHSWNTSTNIYTLDFGNFHISLPGVGGFLPAVKQIANVAALPGIVGVSHALSSLVACAHTNVHAYLLCT